MSDIFKDLGILIFRVSINAYMLFGHGLGKLQKLMSGVEIKFLDPFGIGAKLSFSLAVFTEFFAAGLLILGLFTRISSLSLIITMAVAAFIAHADDPFLRQEKSLIYLSCYILLFFIGPGKYSLQTLLDKKIPKGSKVVKFFLG